MYALIIYEENPKELKKNPLGTKQDEIVLSWTKYV